MGYSHDSPEYALERLFIVWFMPSKQFQEDHFVCSYSIHEITVMKKMDDKILDNIKKKFLFMAYSLNISISMNTSSALASAETA